MEYHFDTSKIIGIKFHKMSLTEYVWLPEKHRPPKFFGLITAKPFPAGFYYGGDYGDSKPRTAEYLKDYNYIINEKKEVWTRAGVTVYLQSEYIVSKLFNSDTEAEAWINSLHKVNGGNFEIVKYE